jgi:hypothetical protein
MRTCRLAAGIIGLRNSEVDDDEHWITQATLPYPPQPGRWYDYRADVLPDSRLKFYWTSMLIFDAMSPERTLSGGPVGMRLDYFDTIADAIRVYQP